MPPATSLRTRIAAFEHGAVTNNTPGSPVLDSSRGGVTRDSSELLDLPISPTANAKFPLLKPSASPSITPPRSRSESPGGLSIGTSVIDLSELDQPIRSPPQTPARPSSAASKPPANPSSRDSSSSYDASRFSFDMASSRSTDSSSLTSPPVPPRKPAFLQSDSQFTSPPRSSTDVHIAQPPHDASDAISSSWYKISPSSSSQFLDVHSALTTGSSRKGHGHALSTSSLQSVSLSSDGDVSEVGGRTLTSSVAETIAAFNNKASAPTTPKPVPEHPLPYMPRKNPRLGDNAVLLPAFATIRTKSPPTASPVKTMPPPLPVRKPALPARPSAVSATSSAQSVPSLSIRRVAPPPPPVTLRSNSVTNPLTARNSSTSSVERRKAPIPPAAQKRYGVLFDENVERASPSRTSPSSNGWRGADGAEDSGGPRMSGAMVKSIWMCSRLPKGTLRQIWAGCDPERTGSLNRDDFVRGMWAIDSELAKATKAAPRTRR